MSTELSFFSCFTVVLKLKCELYHSVIHKYGETVKVSIGCFVYDEDVNTN